MVILFSNDWLSVSQDNNRYFIKYNTGDLINSVSEIEVSKAEAEKAQQSEKNAYEIIIQHQNRSNPRIKK